jgi:septal ring factor EnvC (AmiA/AmiB activator)
VDYSKATGSNVFAPVSGTLTQVVSPTGGNMVVIRDNQGFTHRLMHNSQFIKPNGAVSEGEIVAKSGTTGLSTGPHVHWDINKEGTYPSSFAAFIPPADWLAGKYNQVTPPVAGGNNMFQNDAEVQEAYLLLRGNPGTAAERAGWIGQSKQRFFQVAKPEADSYRTQLTNAQNSVKALTTQVTSLNAKVAQLTTQITTLTNQVNQLTTTVAAKDKEIATLKAQVATGSGEDTALLNGFGELLRKLIVRLGVK